MQHANLIEILNGFFISAFNSIFLINQNSQRKLSFMSHKTRQIFVSISIPFMCAHKIVFMMRNSISKGTTIIAYKCDKNFIFFWNV